MSDAQVIRIKPHHYIHVLDQTNNVTRVCVGPMTFTRQEQERVVAGPSQMVMIPPRHYCIIQNPVVVDKDRKPVTDSNGQVKIRHGDEEVRRECDPFPLYPGETLYGKVSPLQVVLPNTALRLRATRDAKIDGIERYAGDEWLFKGPGTYVPRVEVQVVEIVRATILKPLQALKLRAKKEFVRNGTVIKAGQEYLEKQDGAYLPDVDEEVVETVNAIILTENKALHLRAKENLVDQFGNSRKAGAEWLVTIKESDAYIPNVQETVVGEIQVTVLTNRQYCVICDPVVDGQIKLGTKVLRTGECSFFLQPGERLENGLQRVHVLESETALLLRAREAIDDNGTLRAPGDRWMIYGPCDYVPPVNVEILETRHTIPLDRNEGIYIRDIKTGKVRAHIGSSYMLKSDEEKWEKDLPSVVEEVLAANPGKASVARDKTKVVAYKAPHNTVVQIFDYKTKAPRVVYGPDLVMLGPEEQFTVLSLSGDKPKRPHVIKSLSLQLGPDFMTDIVIVETADHARLSLKLSYNWHFETTPGTNDDKIFAVPDFVGDACKAIASRVRGEVALHSFDEFHRNSAKIIRTAVFGLDEEQKIKNRFAFQSNNLIISNIDIQSVEPVDSRTRDALQKSVQLAIEITTRSQEATARHEAEKREQEARGELERQQIIDKAKAEAARKSLLELQGLSATVEATGAATAEAKAQAARAEIKGSAAVEQSKLAAKASKIKAESELTEIKGEQEAEISHQKALNDLEVSRARDLAHIESSKFKKIVDTIGKDTLKAIATAGPDMQERLLGGLGLKSFSLSGPSSPLNMFSQ
jgi:major vault protein